MKKRAPWRNHWYRIIFEAESPGGRLFDILLLIFIILSVIIVALESVDSIENKYGLWLRRTEWFLTIIFTLEYFARIATSFKPKQYIFSFFGIIDLLAILPTYLSLIFAGTHALIVIRILRLLRMFRILKLVQFLGEANTLLSAIKNSMPKIIVFIFAVSCLSVIIGTTMYIIEGPENGFTSIPRSIYWTIVTLTTVGYGDIAPRTIPGQMLATFIMIIGYGIIAVPTGIVSASFVKEQKSLVDQKDLVCPECGKIQKNKQPNFCWNCGHQFKYPQ
jgi:voltage-gated potassium channel